MERVSTHLKYIKWHSSEELHEDTVRCISELQFVIDELEFLKELVKEHTLDLIFEERFEKSRVIANELTNLRKEINDLVSKIQSHKNNLQTVLNAIKQPKELEDYKSIHYKLMFKAIALNAKFKILKNEIFILIKEILKINKSKRLLN